MACNKNPLEEIQKVEKVFLRCFLAVESFYTRSVSFDVSSFAP